MEESKKRAECFALILRVCLIAAPQLLSFLFIFCLGLRAGTLIGHVPKNYFDEPPGHLVSMDRVYDNLYTLSELTSVTTVFAFLPLLVLSIYFAVIERRGDGWIYPLVFVISWLPLLLDSKGYVEWFMS